MIKSQKTDATPRSFELWYTYMSGHNPEITRAVGDLLLKYGRITQSEIEEIHDKFIDTRRFASEAERATGRVLTQVETLSQSFTEASGQLADYGSTLSNAQDQISRSNIDASVTSVVQDLLHSTREMSLVNTSLVAQLKSAQDEVGELRTILESVRSESRMDPLTGLGNRLFFDLSLTDAVQRSLRMQQPLSLLFCDIDHFKSFNDTYGHVVGDQVLRLVADTMKRNIKGQDIAARYGGEELAVILPSTDLKAAALVANNIRHAVMARDLIKRSTGERLGRVTISVGVAQFRSSDTPTTLIERADKCVYAAKHSGRNRVVTEDEAELRIRAA